MASSKTLEELIASMQKQSYTPLTQEQMQTQSSNRYSGVYDQKRLSANQAYQTSDQALAQQLADLQSGYAKQREEAIEGYRQVRADADRQSLKRGMQRSSYNNAVLANIDIKGQEALQDIADEQAGKEKAIGDQRTLNAQQLATQLASYDAQQKADELAYMDQLEAREYDRLFNSQNAQNALALDIHNAQFNKEQADQTQQNWQTQFDYQKEQDALAQSNWEREFDARYGGGGGGGGYSGGGGRRTSTTPAPDSGGLFGGILDLPTKPSQTNQTNQTKKEIKKISGGGTGKGVVALSTK